MRFDSDAPDGAVQRFAPVRVLRGRSDLPPVRPRDLALTRGDLAGSATKGAPKRLLSVPRPTKREMRGFWLAVATCLAITALAAVGAVTLGHAIAHHWRGALKLVYVTAAAGYLLYVTRRTDR